MTSYKSYIKKQVDIGRYPSILYKYRQFDDEDSDDKYSEDIFRNNSLYAASPDEFNDPFDMQPFDVGPYSYEDYCQHINRVNKDYKTPIEKANKDFYYHNKDHFTKNTRIFLQKELHKLGVISLAAISDDILMWSHYAENHKGFSLGFEVKKDLGFFESLVPVQYKEVYPSTNYCTNHEESIQSYLITKHEQWKYEQEYRLIYPSSTEPSSTGEKPFKKSCLKEVYLGCRISEENREKLKAWLRHYEYHHVKLFQYEKSPTKFALTKREVPF